LVFVQAEAICEELDAESEELAVVVPIENWIFDVADQVLEECSDHDVDYLYDFHVDFESLLGFTGLFATGSLCTHRSNAFAHMELFEVLAARNVLLSCLLVELVESDMRMLLGVDGASEVEGHVVHQEALQLLLEPKDCLIGLHVDIQSAENSFFLDVDIWHQLQRIHVDGDSNPGAVINVDVLLDEVVVRVAANLSQVQREAGLEFLHIHFEVIGLAQFLQLLNNQHGIVLVGGHQQVVVSQSHQAVQLILGWSLQKMKGILFQIGIVEAAQDITETEALWNSFELLELLLVEGDIVILSNIANRG
jgi:hypothetical protein